MSLPIEVVTTRIPSSTMDHARSHAANVGMKISEFIRHAVRRELGYYRDPAALPAEQLDNDALNRRAAFGDMYALREATQRNIDRMVSEDDPMVRLELLAASIVTARLAAEHGDAFDQMKLGGLLTDRGDLARTMGHGDFADLCHANGLARLNVAANRGNEQAAASLNDFALDSSPEALALAAPLSTRIEENL